MKNFLEKYYYLIIGAVAFIIYMLTTAPAVTEFDSGELATVQATLGIAHPPGYPLFTIIGYLFSIIPSPFTPIFQLHILCVIWTTLSTVFFVRIVELIINRFEEFKSPSSSSISGLEKLLFSNFDKKLKYIAIIVSGLIFAFSRNLWEECAEVEVYSLAIFIGILIIYFSLKAFLDKAKSKTGVSKYWMIVAVMYGLGFSNHMMTLYLIPATLYLYFLQNKFSFKSFRPLFLFFIIIAVISVSFYAYLPIRANQNPVMNWGGLVDLRRTIEHVTARYYSKFFFPGWETIKKQLTFFVASIGFLPGKQNLWNSEFNVNILLVMSGVAVSLVMRRRLFVYLILIFITTIGFSVNYNIPDIYTYFSFAFVTLGIFSIVSIAALLKLFSQTKIKRISVISILFVMVVIQPALNYRYIDRSDYYVVEDYTRALLKLVKKDAVVFTEQWDYFLAPSYYVQNVTNYRKDVKIIHKDLIPLDWYMEKEKEEGLIFFNAKTQRFNITKYTAGKDFYMSPDVLESQIYSGKFKLGENQFIIPDVLLFRVVNTEDYYPAPDPDFKIRFPAETTFGVKKIKDIIFVMLQNRIKYELQYGKKDRAKVYLNKIIQLFPEKKIPRELFGN